MPTLDVIFDSEFKALNRPHTEAEAKQLHANILRDGAVHTPIDCWDTKDGPVVVDGYNRAEFYQGLPDDTHVKAPSIRLKKFESREDVIDWMICEQLGRRNLNAEERAYLLGKLVNAEKNKQAGRPKKKRSHFETVSGRASERVAKATGASKSTVDRSSKYQRDIDTIAAACPMLAEEIRSGHFKVAQVTVSKIATCGDIPKVRRNLTQGRKWNDGLAEPEPPKPKKKSASKKRKTDSGSDAYFDSAGQTAWRRSYGEQVRAVAKWARLAEKNPPKNLTAEDVRELEAEMNGALDTLIDAWKRGNPGGRWS